MGASSDGYTVRSGVSGQAGALDDAGDEAGRIHRAVQPAMCYTQDTLGGPEAAAAFDAPSRPCASPCASGAFVLADRSLRLRFAPSSRFFPPARVQARPIG